MKLTLIDRNPTHIQAAADVFGRDPDVSFLLSDVAVATGYDCLISPGNSFGIMDGGFDAAVKTLFGEPIERWIQQRIEMEAFGELNVGCAVATGTGHGYLPYICYAPTMRVPMQITRTDNVYLAMRAALIQIGLHNEPSYDAVDHKPIESILCPLLGTGAGKVPLKVALNHMKLAWDSIKEGRPAITNWKDADALQAKIGLGFGGDPDHF